MSAIMTDVHVDERVLYLLEAWCLIPGESVPTKSGCVMHARRATGESVTLKLVADRATLRNERVALEAFSGRGCVRLLAVDPGRCALLLERAEPGHPLSRLVAAGRDEEATQVGVDVARRLAAHSSTIAPAGLPGLETEAADTLRLYLHSHQGASSPIRGALVEAVAAELDDLMSAVTERAILHGDLHHDNILRADREPWLAIDPKGRLGAPECELAALVRNPIDHVAGRPELSRFLARRLDQLVECAGVDRARLACWSRVLAVVAACWAIEDGEPDWEKWLHVASALR